AWRAARRLGYGSSLQLGRALARWSQSAAPRVWFVTACAQAMDSSSETSAVESRIAVEQSPLVGFVRVAVMELPDLKPKLVDLDAVGSAATNSASKLAQELAAEAAEGEVAYRNGKRFVARL